MHSIKTKGVLRAVKGIRGGVLVAHNKNTAEMEVENITPPQKVVMPMQQHIGAACTPCVKVGDNVCVGQLIGDSESYISAPIHASISGKVTAIGNVKLASGKMAPAVTIESDGEMKLCESIKPPVVETKEDLIKAVRESGLVGLGGAGFPTHVKLNFPPEKKVDTLVVNAAECEPYITVDYRECVDNSWDVMGGVYLLAELLGFKNVILAIEDNKPLAIDVLKTIAKKDDDHGDIVKLMTLKSKYPQGAEKIIVQSATGKRVPKGKLPVDVGCVIMNVATVAFISRYLKTGKPLVTRSITVDGTAIANPKNLRVPIGTEINEIIEFCGGFKAEPYKLIAGGPMMGAALVETQVPLLKYNNAILAFADDGTKIKKERDCIRCGRCAEACPMSLLPTDIERNVLTKNAEELSRLCVDACMECGSCAYACPAGKPLLQYMRLGKEILKKAGDK